MGRPDKIVGSQQQLYAALSRADVDALLKNGAFIQKDGIGLFGGQRGAAALRSSAAAAGTQAMRTPLLSPRATRVLKTCSSGTPRLCATVTAERSAGSIAT